MKFCINCRFYEATALDLPRCQSPHAKQQDRVTGEDRQKLCETMRWSDLPCGPDATLFEPKEGARA
jgi:hypothetical protein